MAITLGNSVVYTSQVATVSGDLTVGTGTNRLLVALLSNEGSVSMSVTYGGVALTKQTEQWNSDGNVALFTMVAPPEGTATLAGSADDDCVLIGAVLYGVDQTTPVNTTAKALGDSTTPSISIASTATDQWVIGGFSLGAGDSAITDSAGQTRIQAGSSGLLGTDAALSYKAGTGGTDTLSWTTSSDHWSSAALIIKPSAASTIEVSVSDSGSIGSTESLDIFGYVNESGTGAIGSIEDLDVAASTSTSDAGAIGGTESLDVAGSLATSDSGLIGVSESLDTFGSLTGADSGLIGSTESIAVVDIDVKSVSDSGAIGGTEESTIISYVNLSDTGTIAGTEGIEIISSMRYPSFRVSIFGD